MRYHFCIMIITLLVNAVFPRFLQNIFILVFFIQLFLLLWLCYLVPLCSFWSIIFYILFKNKVVSIIENEINVTFELYISALSDCELPSFGKSVRQSELLLLEFPPQTSFRTTSKRELNERKREILQWIIWFFYFFKN